MNANGRYREAEKRVPWGLARGNEKSTVFWVYSWLSVDRIFLSLRSHPVSKEYQKKQ